jgi:hypothetical protein
MIVTLGIREKKKELLGIACLFVKIAPPKSRHKWAQKKVNV